MSIFWQWLLFGGGGEQREGVKDQLQKLLDAVDSEDMRFVKEKCPTYMLEEGRQVLGTPAAAASSGENTQGPAKKARVRGPPQT